MNVLAAHRRSLAFHAPLAALFALFVVVAWSFDRDDSAEMIIGSPQRAVATAVVVLALTALFLVMIHAADRLILRAARPRHGARPRRRPALRVLLTSWAAILVGWLPTIVLGSPAAFDMDTFDQLLQWKGVLPPSDHHPWFDTVVFGWFWDLGGAFGEYAVGAYVYTIFQSIVLAALLAACIAVLEAEGLSRRVRWGFVAFIALDPVLAGIGMSMMKDTLFLLGWIPFLFLFVMTVRSRGAMLQSRVWFSAFALSAVVMALTKKTGLIVVVLSLVVLVAVVAGRRMRIRAALVVGAVVLLVPIAWTNVTMPAMGVAAGDEKEMLSVPLQQTARIARDHPGEITAEDRAAIDAVTEYDRLADRYDPRRSDDIKAHWNEDARTGEKLAYFGVWLKQLAQYPGTAIAATVDNTFGYFGAETPYVVRNEFEISDSTRDWWAGKSAAADAREQIDAIFDNLDHSNDWTDAREGFQDLREQALASPIGVLFGSLPLWCSWLPLFLLVHGLVHRRWWLVAGSAPMLLTLLSLIAGPVVFGRYGIASFFGSLLMLAIAMTPDRTPQDPSQTEAGARRTSKDRAEA